MSDSIRQVMITGRVQGVGYRAWVEHQARNHDLEGWVRNRRDGSVEALFVGPANLVSDMVARCRRGRLRRGWIPCRTKAAVFDALNLRRAGERFSVLQTCRLVANCGLTSTRSQRTGQSSVAGTGLSLTGFTSNLILVATRRG